MQVKKIKFIILHHFIINLKHILYAEISIFNRLAYQK